MVMMTDVELMAQFQQGNREAFEKLVMRHQVGVFNFFMRLMNSREAAEDQTQEVFLRLYLHAERYEETAKFTTYLYRIARNCWIDHLRRVRRRGRMQSLDRESAEGVNLYEQLAADTEAPDGRVEAEDRVGIINGAIEALPEDQRVVFVLAEVQGMKYADIADTLGIPLGTVKSRMHVAVQRLRDYLQRHGIVGAA